MVFIGPVADKKFTGAYIGYKTTPAYKLKQYNDWAKNTPDQTTQVIKDAQESGITILDNTNNSIDAAAKTATFEFTRPLKTRYLYTMDIDIDRSYMVYISHGVFPYKTSYATAYVKGAIQSGTSYTPAFEAFKM